MRIKTKTLLISIIVVLILVAIGMSIGLVLVAKEARLSNSLTISFKAENVDAHVRVKGYNYPTRTATEGTAIGFTSGYEAADFGFGSGSGDYQTATFNNATISANGRLVYEITIQNEASDASTIPLFCMTEVTGLNQTDNDGNYLASGINVGVGLDETVLKPMSREISYFDGGNYFVCEVGGGQKDILIYVVITIKDYMTDFQDLGLGIDLTLYYPEPDNEEINSVTTIIKNESNVNSVIEIINSDVFGCIETPVLETRALVENTYTTYKGSEYSFTYVPYAEEYAGYEPYAIGLQFRIYGESAYYTFTYTDSSGEEVSTGTMYFTGKYVDHDFEYGYAYSSNFVTYAGGYFVGGPGDSGYYFFSSENLNPDATITITIEPINN